MSAPGTASTPSGDALPAFLAALERAALVDAARLVGDLAAAGTPVPQIVADLLGPAQVEVGRRWASAAWSVAQEHAATAIIETVLMTASLRSTAPPPGPDAPSLVLVCAEGEWHALPGRMAAEALQASGVRVLFLGPSLPSEVLPEFLRADPPTAVGLSCSLSFALPGALRVVRAAHEAGVPVLAAGQAFGADDRRARAVGADGWAPDVAGAVALLQQWREAPPVPGEHDVPDGEWTRLQDVPEEAVAGPVRALLTRRPRLEAFSPALVSRLRRDAHYALRYGAAAELVDDASVLVDHAVWLAEVLRARRVPGEVVADLHECLADALQAESPRTSAMFREAAAAVSAGAGPRTAEVVLPEVVAP